jgi:hypothetical protein
MTRVIRDSSGFVAQEYGLIGNPSGQEQRTGSRSWNLSFSIAKVTHCHCRHFGKYATLE